METALGAHDTTQSFNLLELVEIYAADYAIPATGFDPDDAERRFCGVQGFTFLGLAYEREYVDRGDAQRFVGKKENACTCNFSNVSRTLADYVQSNDIEGKLLVIRCVDLTSTVLADSTVVFWGRLERPGDVGDTTGSLTVTQRYGPLNLKFPRRTYGPNDSKGRAPNDPLFEGFRFTPTAVTVQWTTREKRPGWGSLIGLTTKVRHSFQASTHTDASAERVVPDGFGRVQLYGDFLATVDTGNGIRFSVSVMEGPIAEFVNIKQTNPKFIGDMNLSTKRWGYPGGQGPVGREQVPITQVNPTFNVPGDGYYSRTVWFHSGVTGSTPDVDEAEAPDFMVLVLAKIVLLPDGSGEFTVEGWTDNPAYVARHLFTSEDYFNEGADSVDDASCLETAEECNEYVIDNSQGERVFVDEVDAALIGDSIARVRSTSLTDALTIRIGELAEVLPDLPELPPLIPVDPEPFDPLDPPTTITPQTVLRRRHSTNLTITESVTGTDFLYGGFAETARLYFPRNAKGRIEIRREKAVDNTRLRVAAVVGDTTVKVMDVEPWKTGPRLLTQRLLTGAHQVASEIRNVTAAAYTADGNAITITKSTSGGVTATLSGATFSGGSASAPASATITIGGAPGAGDSITVTIGGVRVVYALGSYDTTATVAAMLARLIHATPALRQFIKATWTTGSSVVTLSARYGVLTLDSALANAHAAQVANPTTAPTLAAASGGSLPAGTVYVAYAYTNAVGETALSPVASVSVTAGQKVNATAAAFPAGATGINWYIGRYVDDSELLFHSSDTDTTVSFADLPASTGQVPEESNTTGEELMRVAASYVCNDQGATILAQAGRTRGNIHAGTLKWPLGSQQSSVNQLKGTFFNATEDYEPTPIEVNDFDHQARTRKANSQEVNLSGFDNYWAASAHLNFRLSKLRDGDMLFGWSTGPAGMLHEEGDVVCVSGDNGGFVNAPVRLEQIGIGKAPTYTTKLVGRLYSTLMFSDRVRRHSIKLPTTLRYITTLDTVAQLFEVPTWDETDRGRLLLRAAVRPADGRGAWKGYQFWVDPGDGADYRQLASGDVAGTLGELITDLPATSPFVFDTTNAVRVRVDGSMTLASRTAEEVLKGGNLARAGGVLFRFQTATEVSSTDTTTTYDLTGLLIGLYGTEDAVAVAGDDFTLLDGTEQDIDWPLEWLNKEVQVKVATVNRDLADVAAVGVTVTGKSLRHPAPQLVRGHRNVASDILCDWTAAVQGAGGIRQGLRNPLGDEEERYAFYVMSDDGFTNEYRFEVRPGLTFAYVFWEVAYLPWPDVMVSLNADGGMLFGQVTVNYGTHSVDYQGAALRSAQVCSGEAKLVFTVSGLATPTIGFQLFGKDAWLDPPTYYILCDPVNSEVYVEGALVSGVTCAEGDEFTVWKMNGQVRYYKGADVTDSTVPIHTSTVTPEALPYVVVARDTFQGELANVRILRQEPEVVITAEMQTTTFGSLKNPLRVRINRISSLVGEGQNADVLI